MALIVNIHKRLNHFDLTTRIVCESGQLTAIVGPSGSGKTTLIRCIAGLEEPDNGTIALHGRFWWDDATGRFVPTHRRKIGLVFQEYPLFPHLTVRRNIEYGAEFPGAGGRAHGDLFHRAPGGLPPGSHLRRRTAAGGFLPGLGA